MREPARAAWPGGCEVAAGGVTTSSSPGAFSQPGPDRQGPWSLLARAEPWPTSRTALLAFVLSMLPVCQPRAGPPRAAESICSARLVPESQAAGREVCCGASAASGSGGGSGGGMGSGSGSGSGGGRGRRGRGPGGGAGGSGCGHGGGHGGGSGCGGRGRRGGCGCGTGGSAGPGGPGFSRGGAGRMGSPGPSPPRSWTGPSTALMSHRSR